MTIGRSRHTLLAALTLTAGLGCGSSGPAGPGTFTIAGTVTWLTTVAACGDCGLVLGTPGQPELAIQAGQTSFEFPNRVASGTPFAVTVVTHPIPGSCTVTGGTGVVAGAGVTDIAVTCDDRLRSGPLNVARAFNFTAVGLPGGEVLVAGGHTPGSGYPITSTAERFSPRTGRWTMAAPMTTPRASACTALLRTGKVLVAGGAGAAAQSAELYDPGADTWAPTDQPMAEGHDLGACVTLGDGRVLVTGGLRQVSTSSTAVSELFDPDTGTFSTTASMGTARYWHTATVLPGGTVLVAGGCTGGYPCTATTATAEVYDPASGTWSATGSLPAGVFGHTATEISGRVLVAGGCQGDALCGPEGAQAGSAETGASLYDPATGQFEPAGEMSMGRAGHGVVTLDQGFMFIGGTHDAAGGGTTDVYGWDGATWTWAAGPAASTDHGSYLGAASALVPFSRYCGCSYSLAVGGLGPWTGSYALTTAVEGFWGGCGC